MNTDNNNMANLGAIADYLRLKAFETILAAKSGHVGASSSSVELMTALYFGSVLRYDPNHPRHPSRDRILVRGHLGPLRYNIFSLLGWVSKDELPTYRSLGSRLQGHESMDALPGVDITPSGSLGMLLSYGVGSSYALKKQNLDSINYVFLGDGEEQEGNVSEAARHAGSLGLNNLVCIIDQNGKQLSAPTNLADGSTDLAKVWEGYGWDVKIIKDGHDLNEILQVLNSRRSVEKPTLIIARTKKGYGVDGHDNHFSGYHTISTCGPVRLEEAINCLSEVVASHELLLGPIESVVSSCLSLLNELPIQEPAAELEWEMNLQPETVSDNFDDSLEQALRDIVANFEIESAPRLYMLTADWSNKDQIKACNLDAPWINYIDVGIREQHMMAMAHGIGVTDRSAKILIFDGDGFAYRGSDQLHAMAQAKTSVIIIGTDSGLCEARNGSTHQSAGQPGMLAHMPNLTLMEPATETDLFACLNHAFNSKVGPVYLRVHSGDVQPISHDHDLVAYKFYLPTSQVKLNLITSGLIVREALDFVSKVDKDSKVGINAVNVVSMQQLDDAFVSLLNPDVPTIVFFNGSPSVLHGFVTQALLENGGWTKPVKSHGFTLGTTGSLNDLLDHFHLNSSGLQSTSQSTFPEIWN